MIISEIPNRAQTTTDPIVGFDKGDLLSDIDRQIGDVIERTVNRYLDREMARQIRKVAVEDIGEKIITFDRVLKEART